MSYRDSSRGLIRSTLVIVTCLLIVFGLFRLTTAGLLDPVAPPLVGTMHSSDEVFNALVGTFNSSSIVANSKGDALQISKCTIVRMTGGSCP